MATAEALPIEKMARVPVSRDLAPVAQRWDPSRKEPEPEPPTRVASRERLVQFDLD